MIKVSKAPLEQDLRGVSIFSNAVWHETTLAGSENKEMAQYIFGEIEVPKLDEDKSPIAPFDVTRSMRLNPQNEIVRALYAFIGKKVEIVRRGRGVDEHRVRANLIGIDQAAARIRQHAEGSIHDVVVDYTAGDRASVPGDRIIARIIENIVLDGNIRVTVPQHYLSISTWICERESIVGNQEVRSASRQLNSPAFRQVVKDVVDDYEVAASKIQTVVVVRIR